MPYSEEYLNKLSKDFVHLHVHSEYSNIRMLDSINKTGNIISYVNSLGQNAVALTDHECLSGHIKFLVLVEQFKAKGMLNKDFKPILGNEIYLVEKEKMYDEMKELGRTTFYHFLLLAKDNEGHEQLRELSSLAWERSFSYKGIERVPTFYSDMEDILERNKGHLIASTACLGGKFPKLVKKLIEEEDLENQEHIRDEIDEFLNWCIDMFGREDFYIEIQPSLQEEQMTFNKMAIKIAKAYGLEWIVTTDAHYINNENREIHKAYLTSEDDSNGNREIDAFYSTTYFFTVQLIFENLYYLAKEDIERSIINTGKIRDKIKKYDFFLESKIPLTELPNKEDWFEIPINLDDYNNIKELLNSNEKQHVYLIHQIFRGIKERNIPKGKMTEVLKRVDIECGEIIGASLAKHQPMGAYLVTMQKNVDIIWSEANSIVGAGRGCFTKEAMVHTNNGLKSIKDVNIGDYVINRFGNFDRVLDTMEYEINEPMIQFEHLFNASCIKECTLDHKILTYRNQKQQYTEAKDLKLTDYVVLPKVALTNKNMQYTDLAPYAKQLGYTYDENYIYESKNNKKEYDYSFNYMNKKYGHAKGTIRKYINHQTTEAKTMEINKVILPKFQTIENYKKYLESHTYNRKKITRFIKNNWLYNFIIGLLYGDGCCRESRNEICLYINSEISDRKNQYNRRLFHRFAESMGLKVKEHDSKKKNLKVLSINSSTIARMINDKYFCSKLGVHKQFNEELFYQNEKNRKGLWYGFIMSDGSLTSSNENRISFDNTSLSLINAVKILGMSLNKNPHGISKRIGQPTEKGKTQDSYKLRYNKNHCDKYLEDKQFFYLPITKIKNIPRKLTNVYDLTIENDPSYLLTNCIVHNSANGYCINYLLGITQVNPLEQGVEMPHWRFMSAERPDIFDIDIDYSSHKRDVVYEALSNYYKSIGGDFVRVCTFGTETAKSAIQTACRGLNINSDVGLYLSSLIPVERGKVWCLSDCYNGNKKENRRPVTEFKKIVNEYKGIKLLEVALGIEGLINKRSSHACGAIIVNEKFTKHNAVMRTPSGEIVSQYELHDSEKVSNLKYDFLNTKTCSMIQITMEMLVKNKKMEWQGNLRETYNKYLHPDVIDKTKKEMWDILCKGELLSAFQFESDVGEQAIKLIQPHSLIDAANGNTVMRLMVEDGEQPLEKFVRYKNDIQQWYKDMEDFGLKEKEIKILEKHLLQDYGVCSSQERMMLLTMDKKISDFGVIESNSLRKGCAKKIPEIIEDSKKLFFEYGQKNNTPQILLDYIWNEQIAMQLGYGFSILHSIAYTIILIQQMNLAYYYPSIYWNTAVLLVESGALERESAENQESKTKERTTNYGEVAKAIGNLQSRGVKIALPYINEAEQGFKPNEIDNEIVFGFKGITGINNEKAQTIIENRPYKSLIDFHNRLVMVKREVVLSTGRKQMKSLISSSQTIMLIKAGAFDKIESEKTRESLLLEYLSLLNPCKTKLNSKDISKISDLGVLPIQYKEELKYYNFRSYITELPKYKDREIKSTIWYKIDCEDEEITDYTTKFFLEHFANDMEENRDYKYDDEGFLHVALGTSRKGSFENIYSEKIRRLTEWISTEECKDMYNEIIFEDIKRDNIKGNISSWEMESMNYYYHGHELTNIKKDEYDIVDFNLLPEKPNVIGFTKYKGLQYPKFELHRIVGTILDRDKNKHTISILTPSGVVTVKFYSGQFAFYDRTISRDIGVDDKGKTKKQVLEDGWFKRGTKVLITGFRRGDQFKPKRYKNSIYQHTVSKILEIKEDGSIMTQSDRVQEVKDE